MRIVRDPNVEHTLYLFLIWLRDEGWIKDELLDQAPDITVSDFVHGY